MPIICNKAKDCPEKGCVHRKSHEPIKDMIWDMELDPPRIISAFCNVVKEDCGFRDLHKTICITLENPQESGK